MKAARWYGKEDVRIEEIEDPKPGKKEVKIEIKYCGICGSDLHYYQVGQIDKGPKLKLAQILGHEISGEIVELGQDVEDWKISDRVTVDAKYYCRECYYCKRNMESSCVHRVWIGEESGNGGFAEYISVPTYMLYRLPENMSHEEGAFVEPLGIGTFSVIDIGGVKEKEVNIAAVVGAGPIGNLQMQVLKAIGIKSVYVIEMIKTRCELAKKLGADEVLNPKEVNVKKAIYDLTNGRGVDFAFECGGTESSLQTCIDITKPGGTIISIALHENPVTLFFTRVPNYFLSIIGTTGGVKRDYVRAIDLISEGKMDINSLISSKIKLDDLIEKGFKELISRKESHMKILVSPK